MIARYNFQAGIDDYDPRPGAAPGRHRAGRRPAGQAAAGNDHRARRSPRRSGLEEEDVQLLFGPEVPRNREFRSQRVNWINRLFVPLAQAYLDNAVDDVTDEPISHTDPEIVDPAVLDSLQDGVQQAARARATTTCSRSCELYLRQGRVRGRRSRRLRRAAVRLLPADRRAPRPTSCCWPVCRRSSATSSNWCGCTCRCRRRGSCPCTTTTPATGTPTRTRRGTTRA